MALRLMKRLPKKRSLSSITIFSIMPPGFCFGSLVILDVACCYLWLFTLYINIKIGKNSC